MNGAATVLASLEKFSSCVIGIKERSLQNLLRNIPSWITPDHFSLARMGFAFPILVFILSNNFPAAFIFFVVGALLDLVDGPLARLRKQETERGKFLDIFADKVLGCLTLIAIFLEKPNLISNILFAFILGTDLMLVVLWLLGVTMPIQHGISRRLGVNVWGRWKFFLQAVGLPLLLIEQAALGGIFLWISVPLALLNIIAHLALRKKQ